MEQTTINVFGAAYTVGQFIGLLVLAYYIVSAVIVLFEESVILSSRQMKLQPLQEDL